MTTKFNVIKLTDYTIVDVKDFLKYDVEHPEFLQILNGLRSSLDIVDTKKIVSYMDKINQEYSKSHGLCEVCHSELKKLRCPNMC